MKVQLNTFNPNNNYSLPVQKQNTKSVDVHFSIPIGNFNAEHLKANYMPVSFGNTQEPDEIPEDNFDEYSTGFEDGIDPIDIDIVGPFEEEEDIDFFEFIQAMEEMTGVPTEVKDGNSVPYNITIAPETVVPGRLSIVHDENDIPARLKVANFKAPYIDFSAPVYIRKADFKNFQMNEVNGKSILIVDSRFFPDWVDDDTHNSFKEGARFDNVKLDGELGFYNSSFVEMNIENCKAESLRLEKSPAAYDLFVKDCEFGNIDIEGVRFRSKPVFQNITLEDGVYHHSENVEGSCIANSYFDEGADLSGIDPDYLKNGFLFQCGYKDDTEDDFILPKGVEFEDLGLYNEELFFETFEPAFEDITEVYLETRPKEEVDKDEIEEDIEITPYSSDSNAQIAKTIKAPGLLKDFETNSIFAIETGDMKQVSYPIEEAGEEVGEDKARDSEAKKLVDKCYTGEGDKGILTSLFPISHNPDFRVN